MHIFIDFCFILIDSREKVGEVGKLAGPRAVVLAAAGQVGAVTAPRIWTRRGDRGRELARDLPISFTIREANTPFLSDFPWQMLFWCLILNIHTQSL